MLRRKFFAVVALLAGAALFAAPNSARATFELSIRIDGGPMTLVASGADFGAISYTGTASGIFDIRILGGSSTNGNALSDLLGSTTRVTNLTGANHVLQVFLTQTNYSLPSGNPLIVSSSMGGTVNTGTVVLTNIFQAYADATNAAYGTGGFTNGPQTAVASGSSFDTGSVSGLFTRSGDYSLTSVVTLDMSGGAVMNYSNQINVQNVPAPAGLVLALSGMPVLGVGTWLRRRKV